MEHPNVKLEVEMAWEPQLEGYGPHSAGLADDSPYRGKMSFDECVEAIAFLADYLGSHNLLDPEDDPEDVGVEEVTAASEQLLLEALYRVHDRWHTLASDEWDEDMESDEDGEPA